MMLRVNISFRQTEILQGGKTHIVKVDRVAESKNIKEVVNQVAVLAAMVVMMVLRGAEAESQLTTVVSH